MSVYRVAGEEWATDILVDDDDVIIDSGPALAWTHGFEWVHISRYFKQHGFEVDIISE